MGIESICEKQIKSFKADIAYRNRKSGFRKNSEAIHSGVKGMYSPRSYNVIDMSRSAKESRYCFLLLDRHPRNDHVNHFKVYFGHKTTFLDQTPDTAEFYDKLRKTYLRIPGTAQQDNYTKLILNDPTQAAFWNRWYCWEKRTVSEAEEFIEENFDIQFI